MLYLATPLGILLYLGVMIFMLKGTENVPTGLLQIGGAAFIGMMYLIADADVLDGIYRKGTRPPLLLQGTPQGKGFYREVLIGDQIVHGMLIALVTVLEGVLLAASGSASPETVYDTVIVAGVSYLGLQTELFISRFFVSTQGIYGMATLPLCLVSMMGGALSVIGGDLRLHMGLPVFAVCVVIGILLGRKGCRIAMQRYEEAYYDV